MTHKELRQLRKSTGKSMAAFCRELGINYFKWRRWEAGKVAAVPDTAVAIIKLYLSRQALLGL